MKKFGSVEIKTATALKIEMPSQKKDEIVRALPQKRMLKHPKVPFDESFAKALGPAKCRRDLKKGDLPHYSSQLSEIGPYMAGYFQEFKN